MTDGDQPCYHCGKEAHLPDKCFFKKQFCRKCGKQGHIAKVCKQSDKKPYDKKPAYPPRGKSTFKKGQHKNHFTSAAQPTSEEPATSQGEWGLFALSTTSDAGIKVDMELNGTNVSMIRDTGASVTLISSRSWNEKFPIMKLDKSERLLKTYSGEEVQVLGQAQILVDYKQQKTKLPLLIVEGDGPSLLDRNWLKSIKLYWKVIKHVTVQGSLDFLLDKYSVLFQNELVTISRIEAKLSVKSDAVLKFCRARSVPYALKEAIEKDLE